MELALLILGAAAFYAGAMILMKFWGAAPPVAMAALIAGAMALGAWCEVEALRIERLSVIYVAVLGVECLVIAGVSFVALGEDVSPREVLGGLVVVAGVAIAAT
ncbi:hypothetical protein [Rubrimonas cliftonensis]|uniref:Quaternary ammonium compound-resistance protein SugE n=1 Tax=Rubrimonas cliftonensis TaxID=89524 RepID=A0A1H4DMF5_9RHOB|nr:hypothetical protein [Rubrimonas cliftonensis]SEA73689.1 quaternary ammonium compound-resistance protein SugE [Rubrimonas cliftonensis]